MIDLSNFNPRYDVIAFKTRSQENQIRLFNQGRLIADHSVITRILVCTGDQTFDSLIVPTAFEITVNHIAVRFGLLFANVGLFRTCLTTFDPTNTAGVSWSDRIYVDLRECC